jgi:hypothetical protein
VHGFVHGDRSSSAFARLVGDFYQGGAATRRRWRAPSPGSALGAPARHGRAALVSWAQINPLIQTPLVLRGAIFLGFDCLARRHRV